MGNEITVSVVITSYNYENYIREAIDSVLMQEVNFKYEILVNDDASTDNSADILKEYELKYPDKFNIIYQNENQYSKGVKPWFDILFPIAKGKYIALCEGDDYWTDPLKLQKQIDFLEANPEYGMCFHPVRISKNGDLLNDHITREVPDTTNVLDLAIGNYIHTPSVVFRNTITIPNWFKDAVLGDWTLYMLISSKGSKIKKLDEPMAVYRIHDSNFWSKRSQQERNRITHLNVKLIYNNMGSLNPEVQTILRTRIKRHSKSLYQKLKLLLKRLKNKLS